MAEQGEVLLKFKVDTSEVQKEIKKAMKGTTGGGGGGVIGTSGGDSHKPTGTPGGSGGSGGLSGLGISPAMITTAAISLVGKQLIDGIDRIMTRKEAHNTAITSSMNMANAGLTSGVQYQTQMMQANLQNQMGMWGNIPIISSMIEGKMKRSDTYQKFQVEATKQEQIQGDIGSSTMGAYDRARSMGYKMSNQEMDKLMKINEVLANERMQAQQHVNEKLQQTKGSRELSKLNMKFNEENDTTKVITDLLTEMKTNAMDFYGNILGVIKSIF